MRLTELSIERPVATLTLLASLMVLGAVGFAYLPLDFMPTVDEPEIDVEVPFAGSHPLEGVRQVVMPLEEEIAGIPGIRSIESGASAGSSEIEVRFDWGADIDLKKMEVREAVERVRPALPAGVGFIGVRGDQSGPAGGAILQGRISAERDLSESWDLLERRIGRPLERIQGVARVDLYGVEPQEVRIDLDLDALKRHAIVPGELLRRLEAENVDHDLGAIRDGRLRWDARATGRFRDVAELRELRIGDGLRLGDVARVERREPRLPYGRHLDRRFAIGIDVFKEPTANTVETVDRLMLRVAEIERDPQLAGIKLLVWDNAGQEIRNSIAGLRDAGLLGGVLAVAVLYGFLRRWRTTAIVSSAIPFSLLVTCGAMYLLGAQLNVLTLLGLMLGVGMLVDNGIVVIENIHRHESLGVPARRAATIGAREVALAVVASTATTLIVWSWLLVSDRSELTIYIGQVALALCLSVTCSLVVSLSFLPLAASRFAPRSEVRPGLLIGRLVPAYRRLLGFTLRHRLLTLVALAALAGSAALPLGWIDKTGEPRFRQKDVPIVYQIHDPATKEILEGYVDRVEEVIEQNRAELGYESLYSVWGEDGGYATTRVYLPEERATDDGVKRLREQLEPLLPVIPGVALEVGDRDFWHRRGGSEGRRMVPLALHGEDPEFIETLAGQIEERLRGIPGSVEIYGPSLRGQREVRLRVDPERTRAAGLSPQQVADAVGFAFRGQQLRHFADPRGELRMIVGLPEGAQPGLAALEDLPLPRGALPAVPLGAVAEVELARTPPRIERENRRTTGRVSVQFEEAVTTDEAQRRVAARLSGFAFPEGYGWSWGEWGRRHDDALATMTRGVLLSLLVVVLLMAALFESLLQPLAIVVTLPLAFFGAFWALWLGGYSLDAVAFVGVIVLIGLVVNNGIVMVDHVNALRRSDRPRQEALIEGCGDRLRPILMTAITTIFGLVPLAWSGYTVAGAYIDSLALAMIGGLASSTVFTLVALPVWYTAVEDSGALLLRLLPRRTRRERRAEPATVPGGAAPQ